MRLGYKALALATLAANSLAGPITAQPATDIYIGPIDLRDQRDRIGPLHNFTDRDGYDNQPHFTPDGVSLLYTSIREDGQADTYRYDLASGTTTRVTHTAESEYSPTVMPNQTSFSVVQVEADSTQRLWHFDPAGQNLGVLLESAQPVGYHAWADSNTVALYILGEPNSLQLADLASGRAEIIEHNIGRSLHPVPGRRAISYLHIVSDDERWITELDLDTKQSRPLVRALPGNEHYTWAPDGSILMGSGSVLYRWTRDSGADWIEWADLAPEQISGITRLAVSRDGTGIAVVGARPDPGADR